MPNFVQIRSKQWPYVKNKEQIDIHTLVFFIDKIRLLSRIACIA